ncbi:molybdopterin-synthase adenylyltransferase MoeB, partial [Cellulomonas massiliensis]|uniref:molybdopterin-synthase adenylyltransferase MoeB n=1 Tax=Cellulomonas massiliensis TaxID=1465811 RepID=UPI00036369EF
MPSGLPPLVAPGPPLTPEQLARAARHLLLPGIGVDGQRRLRAARVCVVGAGGLGAPVLQYLAAAGVGTIGVVDDDVVDTSNLQRQVVHGVADVGRPKVDSARDALAALDPSVEVVAHRVRLTDETVDGVLGGYDLVVDGSDNFPTRYLVDDACARLGLPLVWGSVLRFDAQVSVFWAAPPGGVPGTRLRDVFPEPPDPATVESCDQAGVLGALCGQVGSLMATEAVKLVTGLGEPLLGRLLVLDALRARWREVPLRPTSPRADATPARDEAAEQRSVPATPSEPTVSVGALAAALDDGGVLVDVREPHELAAGAIPGARLVPLRTVLDGSAVAGLPRDRPLYVTCQSGVRSAV